jgi:hypothetical protein
LGADAAVAGAVVGGAEPAALAAAVKVEIPPTAERAVTEAVVRNCRRF